MGPGSFRNISLIGMPGSGKSTVGVILAKAAAMAFVDTDIRIQQREGATLQEIVDARGHLALRRIEEEVILSLDLRGHVIATGGSAVYSPSAMAHLRHLGAVVYLETGLPTLRARLGEAAGRGIAKRPDQSIGDLYRERTPLYASAAHLTVACEGLSQEAVAEAVLRGLPFLRGVPLR